jgi:hypothetical protein
MSIIGYAVPMQQGAKISTQSREEAKAQRQDIISSFSLFFAPLRPSVFALIW